MCSSMEAIATAGSQPGALERPLIYSGYIRRRGGGFEGTGCSGRRAGVVGVGLEDEAALGVDDDGAVGPFAVRDALAGIGRWLFAIKKQEQ
jgi:hypothetical protein